MQIQNFTIMSNVIKLRKGLDLPLKGQAEKKVVTEIKPDVVAIKPTDFKGLTPKLTVKEGDSVKAGSPLFADKMHPDILFTSPVSGKVEKVIRGEKRKLLAVTVKADTEQKYENFKAGNPADLSAGQIKSLLLQSGLWASLIQRPYGIVANPDTTPKAVFVSGFNTAPNAADIEFTLGDQLEFIQAGIDAIAKVSGAKVHLSLCGKSFLEGCKNVEIHRFEGKHPAGNVGIQIHHISPIRKGETVWTVSPLMLAAIGKLLLNGKLDLSRLVALTGPDIPQNCYVKGIAGMKVKELGKLLWVWKADTRFVSGDALSGTSIGEDGFLGFRDDQFTFLLEGDYNEMFGWANPIRSKQFSASHAYFSWLCPRKRYKIDTNLHGGVRAFMFNTVYTDVLPMHIFPVHLCKACMAGDIDKMEKYGIYEVLPEDLATCEFVCPSKIEWQDAIRSGIDLMLKEMV